MRDGGGFLWDVVTAVVVAAVTGVALTLLATVGAPR